MCIKIEDNPIVEYPERKEVTIIFDGKKIKAREGEPIAAALLINGINTFRYTEKTKEERSLFCGIGQCNDCVVIVNGQPNVRSCITLVKEGMEIETQHGLGRMGVL